MRKLFILQSEANRVFWGLCQLEDSDRSDFLGRSRNSLAQAKVEFSHKMGIDTRAQDPDEEAYQPLAICSLSSNVSLKQPHTSSITQRGRM